MSASLAFVVTHDAAAAIIGARGASVKAIKAASGVHSIHLSSNIPGKQIDRTAVLTGPKDAVLAAFDKVDATLRAEVGLGENDDEDLRLLVPDGSSTVGPAAVSALRKIAGVRACVGPAPDAPDAKKQRVITCTGSASQLRSAVHHTLEQLERRHAARHKDFYAQWSFPTSYNDHFETPKEAYADIAPLLRQIAAEAHGTPGAPAEHAMPHLTVWDPYFCQGGMREALCSATGCAPERVLNENVDCYRLMEGGGVPPHDALVTNPPYSGEHKQRLLNYLLACERDESPPPPPPPGVAEAKGAAGGGGDSKGRRGAPFLLLLPAWLADSDYWRDFLDAAAAVRKARRAAKGAPARRRRRRERRAGVFYVCPRARYGFAHPEGTGHATSPFHAVWFCGGWRSEGARRRAQRALRAARRGGTVEVFRAAAMLRKRGVLAERT